MNMLRRRATGGPTAIGSAVEPSNSTHCASLIFVLIGATALLQAACSATSGEPNGSSSCTLEARAGITLTTIDSLSGQPITTAGSVSAQDGSYIEKATGLPPQYWMAYERKGTYAVAVQVDGFQPWRATNVVVSANSCHVNAVTLTARLVR